MAKNKTKKKAKGPIWNLKLLYDSPYDLRIEADITAFEKVVDKFAQKYDVPSSPYLADAAQLKEALELYEGSIREAEKKFGLYLYFLRDIDAANPEVPGLISQLEDRMAKVENKLTFFAISLGQISPEMQQKFLSDPALGHFKVFLGRIFDDAKHRLSIPEEKIMNLKSIPAYNMWVSANERILNVKSIRWKGKSLPLAQALGMLPQLATPAERKQMSLALAETLKTVAPFAEAEINAVVTNKRINDELRGYKTSYENTVEGYRNDPKVVENLVNAVTRNFTIAHRFFKVKAKLLKLKRFGYPDRAAKIGKVKTVFTFETSARLLKEIFAKLNPKFGHILETFLKDGRVDAHPRIGKKSGAYCWGSYSCPTFVLLNHTDDLHSFTTFAHEFGHAFHTEFSRSQGALYSQYSTSLAETASTLFETIALNAVFDKLAPKEKIIVLHDRISDDIATVFRQIACFNYEKDIHEAVRAKGYVTAERLGELHNKHMASYLGPLFKMEPSDGFYFVHWGHIRRFFYVYSYAYGQLVTKALLRRYKSDPAFWSSIEKFLSSGGRASPEKIMEDIGIDIHSPQFWGEGLKEIEADIEELEQLTRKK